MDNLTHSLVGWTLARAGAGRGVPYATATLVVASNAPDVDVVVALFGGVEYLAAHRGPTHGPLGIAGLGLVVAAVMWTWTRWRGRRAGATGGGRRGSFVRWWLLAMLGILGHALMDLPTVYGTRLLSPFSGTWFAVDWMPIIDVSLWIALAGALAAGRLTGRPRPAAVAGLALLLGDYAARAALHERALAQGAAFDAAGRHAPCARAPRWVAHRGGAEAMRTGAEGCLEAAALPTFVSPFTWRIVRQSAAGYEISDRSVLAPSTPLAVTTLRSHAGPEVQRARQSRAGEVYLDFARFPIVRVVAGTTGTRLRLYDARFTGVPADAALGEARTPLSVDVPLAAAAGPP